MRTPLVAALLTSLAHSLLAQPPISAPKFEATSIQPSGRATNPFTWNSGGTLHGERFELRKATLVDLIQLAYRMDPDAIAGGPDWLAVNRYDIAAKAPAGTSQATLKLMLQSLLADRFGVVLRSDMRPLPAFILSAETSKPKIIAATGAGESGCRWHERRAGSQREVYFCRNLTMDGLATALTGMLWDYGNVPVVNSTGLAGAFDFDLEYHQRTRPLPAGTPRVTIFDALARQGLTLNSGSAPAPVIAIERAHAPTPDATDVAKLIPPRETTFEVASVRLSKLDHQDAFDTTKAGTFEARGADLRGLITHARDIEYSHTDEYVFGVPGWNEGPRYDITAKPATLSGLPMTDVYRDDQMRLMLWNLLVERLQIKFHIEQRPGKTYALTATADAQKKLKKADPSHRPQCEPARGLIENDPRDSHPELSRFIVCRNTTMAQLAAQLLGLAPDYFSQEVTDETHLAGHYDFTLSFSESDHGAQASTASQNPDEASLPRMRLSLMDAVQKQLGVRLEARPVMVPAVVIDHYEKMPIEN